MSRWRVAIDGGEWFVSEIADHGAGGESFATEQEAIEELRRIQLRAVLHAEASVRGAEARLQKMRKALAAPPKITRRRSVA